MTLQSWLRDCSIKVLYPVLRWRPKRRCHLKCLSFSGQTRPTSKFPLPPQYQLIPFPVNISQSEQFLIHDTILLFRGKRVIPLVDALEKRCDDLDRRDSSKATSNIFTLRLGVGTPAPRTVILNGRLT